MSEQENYRGDIKKNQIAARNRDLRESGLLYKKFMDTIQERQEAIGDTSIQLVDYDVVVDITSARAKRKKYQMILLKFTDGDEESLYVTGGQKRLSIRQLTDIRDRIIEQREALRELPREQIKQIGQDWESRTDFSDTPDSARPYQDFLRNRQLGQLFDGLIKIDYPAL